VGRAADDLDVGSALAFVARVTPLFEGAPGFLWRLAAAGRPFGVCYFELGGKRVYSLRSVHGVDVSEIAKAYGGGGHPAAAGFEVPVGFTVEDPWGAAK